MISSIPCTRQRGSLSVCFVGHHACGKTSVIYSCGMNANSTPYRPKSNNGVSFDRQSIVLENGMNVKFQVQEISGYECFNQSAMYLLQNRTADAVVVMYDITSQESFQTAKSWVETLKRMKQPQLQIFLVGNKKDLSKWRTVNADDAAMYAEGQNVNYAETTAKRGRTVKKLLTAVANSCYDYAYLA